MRLLANENVPPTLIKRLREQHDVLSAKESMRGEDDPAILARAMAEGRVLLTFDKDFGEMAFRSGLPAACGVILIRMTVRNREEDARYIAELLAQRDDWAGAFWVISRGGIRKRTL